MAKYWTPELAYLLERATPTGTLLPAMFPAIHRIESRVPDPFPHRGFCAMGG